MTLNDFLTDTHKALEIALLNSFQPSASLRLKQAIHYSLLDGGKRLRPALVRASAEVAQADSSIWISPASALEMIHVYSLIHDDLPAMDNDDLRRGKPTNHRQFDEATAILAGDALQTEAFNRLASNSALTDSQARKMILTLSEAAGAKGMVGGQMIDLQSENQTLSLMELQNLHALKTGALIRSALKLGVLCHPEPDSDLIATLDQYGTAIGLAFQIIDDILDVTATTEMLGKPQGSDAELNKSTYVSLLGLDGAKAHAQTQHELALDCLRSIHLNQNALLWQLADYVVDRQY